MSTIAWTLRTIKAIFCFFCCSLCLKKKHINITKKRILHVLPSLCLCVCVRERDRERENASGKWVCCTLLTYCDTETPAAPISLGGLWGCRFQLVKQQWRKSVMSFFPKSKVLRKTTHACACAYIGLVKIYKKWLIPIHTCSVIWISWLQDNIFTV